MTIGHPCDLVARPRPERLPRVLLADRGDALVDPLSAAMRERFDVLAKLDTELTRAERLVVAGATVRPTRQQWADRFFKSGLGVTLRSRRARAGLAAAPAADVVFQTHALFETSDARTVMYVDCTHRQSMESWPDWNPLRGRGLERWLAREAGQYQGAAHVFAFYEATARSLVEQYGVPEDRVSVVGAGVNFEEMPEPAAALRHPPTVLFVGNDFERKGGPLLLEAFAALRARVPEARLRIVGTPHALPAQAGVEQLGRVHGRDQMSQLYAEADVFCLPSRFDPFPGALLEAMAHALPSVVSDVCGIPEIVDGRTALTVSHGPRTVVDLADALERLVLDREGAVVMGLAARQRVEERFLWSHVVARMAPVIERLAHPETHVPAPPAPLSSETTTTPGDTTMTQTDTRPTQPSTFTDERPWGAFQQFSLNQASTVKIITVQPGRRLSLQRHEHRHELWQVLDGVMDIEVDGRRWTAQHGEQIWVPAGSTHRMGNSGGQPTRILELAFGHFDEQDIERLEDDYDR